MARAKSWLSRPSDFESFPQKPALQPEALLLASGPSCFAESLEWVPVLTKENSLPALQVWRKADLPKLIGALPAVTLQAQAAKLQEQIALSSPEPIPVAQLDSAAASFALEQTMQQEQQLFASLLLVSL